MPLPFERKSLPSYPHYFAIFLTQKFRASLSMGKESRCGLTKKGAFLCAVGKLD